MENLEQEDEEDVLELSAISNDPEDEFPEEIHELEMEDTMEEPTQDKSAFTDTESFASIDHFPLSNSNISNASSLHLNSSADTTKDESFGGGKKRKTKTKKHKKTKKTNKSKKVIKNRATKKSKKTKKRRSSKIRLKKHLHGGFIGDNGIDMESYGGTNPYSVERDSDTRF